MIERDGPLATILDSVAQGERVILISGVPGVGKTTLLEAAVERIGAPTVLTARATEAGEAVAWGVLTQLLDPFLREDECSPVFEGPGEVLREVLRWGRATADRAALVLALRWVILHLADRGLLVITVDDAQWADEASAAVISGALALVPDARIVSLGTVREGSVTAGSHLDVVMASSLVVRVPALTRDGVAALIGERTLDADDVHRLTGGVPFYVKAMLAAHDAGEDAVTPSEVARSVAARLARRGEDARSVAVATALLDSLANDATLAALLDSTPSGIDDAMATLRAEGIAAADGSHALSHPIVTEAVTASLTATERARWHERIASTLASLGYPLPDRAPHLLATPPLPDAARAGELERHGVRLRDAGSPASAIPYLQGALARVGDDDAMRARVLETLAQARVAVGDLPGAAEARAERILLLTDPVDRAYAHASHGDTLFPVGDYEGAQEAYERGLRLLSERGHAPGSRHTRELLARMLTAQLTLTPHLSEVATQSLREIAAQDPAEDTLEDARLIAAGGIGLAMTLAGDVFDAEDAARRAFATWPRGQEGFSADPTTYMLSGLLNMVELYDEGLALLDDAVRDAHLLRQVHSAATAHYCRGAMHLHRGAIAAATADLEQAHRATAVGWSHFSEITATFLARCYVLMGRSADAAAIMQKEPSAASPLMRHVEHVGRAETFLAMGRFTDALAHARLAGELVPVGLEPMGVNWRASAVLALLALRRRDEAQELLTEMTSGLYATMPQRVTHEALHLRAIAAEGTDDALLAAEEALVTVSPRRRLDRAQSALLVGARLVEAGHDAQRAEALLREAADYAASERMPEMERGARRALNALGVSASPRPLARASLTDAEFRVVALAAQGLSNREIAAALFVSMKTVEFHLSRSFRKLGVKHRGELAGALALGLEPVDA